MAYNCCLTDFSFCYYFLIDLFDMPCLVSISFCHSQFLFSDLGNLLSLFMLKNFQICLQIHFYTIIMIMSDEESDKMLLREINKNQFKIFTKSSRLFQYVLKYLESFNTHSMVLA